MEDLRELTRTLRRAGHEPVPRPGAQPRHAGARVGPQGARARRRTRQLLPFPDRELPDAYGAPCRRSFRPSPRQLTLRRRWTAGCGRRSTPTSGSQLGQSRRLVEYAESSWRWPTTGSRCSASTRSRSPGRDGHRLPEPARGARVDAGTAHGGPDRLPRHAVQGRGDRGRGRPAGVPRTGRALGKVSDLAYHNGLMVHIWSMLASRDARLASMRCRRCRAHVDDCLDHLRALPRRHRLGRRRRVGRRVRGERP